MGGKKTTISLKIVMMRLIIFIPGLWTEHIQRGRRLFPWNRKNRWAIRAWCEIFGIQRNDKVSHTRDKTIGAIRLKSSAMGTRYGLWREEKEPEVDAHSPKATLIIPHRLIGYAWRV